MKYIDIGDFGDAYSSYDVTSYHELFEANV